MTIDISSVFPWALSFALLTGWYFIRLRGNGESSPPTVPYYIPFGFDTMYQAVTVLFSSAAILINSTITEMLILTS